MAVFLSQLQSLDFVNPPLVRVDGRTYMQPFSFGPSGPSSVPKTTASAASSLPKTATPAVPLPSAPDGEELPSETFTDYIYVAPMFVGAVIGKGGETRRSIETKSGATVFVPRKGAADSRIRISGTEAAVASACTLIEIIIDDAIRRAPPTHFISIPLLSPSLRDGCEFFKQRALELMEKGLDPGCFTPTPKLHLTIAVLRLYDEATLKAACEALKLSVPREAAAVGIRTAPTATVETLEYMNDDPSKVDVLYSQIAIDGNDTALQEMVDGIVTHFEQSGLLTKETPRVKLHVSMIRSKGRPSFDARPVLKALAGYRFGQCLLDRVQLCAMRSEGDGYECVESVLLPSA